MANTSTYFAADTPENTATNLLNKSQSFFMYLRSNSYLEKLNLMYRAYYGAYNTSIGTGHQIQFGGEQGELTMIPVNHFRNIASHIQTMICANRPVMEARAVNLDSKSQKQAYLANGILDYYMREKGLEDALKRAVEMSIVLGAGFVKMEWNGMGGEEFDVDEDTNEIIYSGEVEFSNPSPLDIVVDGTKEAWDNDLDWVMVRSYKNRFNLMAKYPDLADKIKGIPSKNDYTQYKLGMWTNDDTDDICVYEFFHKKTEALPNGRYILFLSGDCILLDMAMPYSMLPIFRISPSTILGTPYGYSPMFDLLPLQEAVNSTFSTILTNNNNLGVQNIWVPANADININTLQGAMNIISGTQKPEALNLTQTAPETFQLLNLLVQSMETISGVNSVARGNPEASLKSGTALALVQSMALQFISGLQQSYVKLIEDTGTSLINILKAFANTPKLVSLVGKNNRPYLKEFTGDDIRDINRVIVDMGNPLSRCHAKDTPILMFDGTVKMVQDIKIGDLVMGPDSKVRTVVCTNSDQEMMYEVRSKDKHQNVSYGCNESHILTLKYCSADRRYKNKQYEEVDVSIKEYLTLSKRQKRLLMGFRKGVEFGKKDLKIPPYILGAWLGDGHSRTTALTTADQELLDSWKSYAESLGLKIRVDKQQENNKSVVYHITSGEANGSSDRNEFMNHLRNYKLIQNKHIPHNYLTSSREDRLELLAGLIDTDGHRVSKCETYVFTQKDEKLTNQVVFLARSLGFRVTTHKRLNKPGTIGDYSEDTRFEVNTVTIGGNTWEIPVKIERKKCPQKRKSRDWLNYGIEVTPVGIGTFYGFTLKEEPHYLLGDFTVTHNTIAGRVQMAEQLLQMNLLTSPEQYFQVINTGRLDATYQGEMAELFLVQSENEKLLEGENPIVSPLDKHKLHIDEHKAVLADPDLRTNPTLVKIVMDHIEDHLNALRQTDPALLQLIGEQPVPPLPQPGGQPPGPQGPMPPQGPPGMPPGPSPMPQGGMPTGQPHPNHPPHNGGRPHKQGPTSHAARASKMANLLAEPNGVTVKGSILPKVPEPPKIASFFGSGQ